MKNVFLSIIYLISMLGMLFISVCFLVFIYWKFAEYEPLVVNVDPMLIENPNRQVKTGDRLMYYTDTCRNYTGTVRVTRTFISENVLINIPEHKFEQDSRECKTYVNSSVIIPNGFPEGEYVLEVTSFFQVNPVREVSVKILTEPFEVVSS